VYEKRGERGRGKAQCFVTFGKGELTRSKKMEKRRSLKKKKIRKEHLVKEERGTKKAQAWSSGAVP